MKQSEVNKIVAQHYQSFLLGKEYGYLDKNQKEWREDGTFNHVLKDSWRGFLLHVNQIVKEMTENGE